MKLLITAISLTAAAVALALAGSQAARLKENGPRPVIDAGKYFNLDSPTSGLQEAIDAAGPAGGLIVIPPGIYPLKQSLSTRSGVTLRGSGPATVLRKEPGAASLLAADCPAKVTEVAVKDTAGFEIGGAIALRDREQVGWYITHAIVKAIRPGRIILDRPTTRDYRLDRGAVAVNFFPAITAEDQSALAIEDLQIDGDPAHQPTDAPGDFTFAAVHLVRCTRARVRDVLVTGWPSDGIGVQGGSDAQVIGCQATGCRGHGFHPGTELTGATFTGNVARDNAWDGLFFCARVRQTTVSSNVFTGNGWSGIGGLGNDDDEWNTCSGNICANNGRAGIEMNDGRNNTATGNVCVNNSRSASGRWAGIDISNCTGCLVTGNRCADDQERPTQQVGIRESGRSDYNQIRGNQLHGSQKAVEKIGPHTQGDRE
jgi:parallel beta-helix repeat protein